MTDGSNTARPAGEQVAFLVGAGRSGTTLLQKLLCLHPQIAYISNYENRFPWFPDGLACSERSPDGWMKSCAAWFDKGGNAYFIKRPWFKKLFPTPHEGESVFESCGIPLFPAADYRADAATAACLRRRFEQFRRRSGAARIPIKANRQQPANKATDGNFPRRRVIYISSGMGAKWPSPCQRWNGGISTASGGTAGPRLRWSEQANRASPCARATGYAKMQELQLQLAPIDPRRLLSLRFEDLLQEPRAPP